MALLKRAHIQLSGQAPKFRISRPGVDVDSAAATDFLLHEQFLYAQPYFFGQVPCPFADYSGTAAQSATVVVDVPPVTGDPLIFFWVSGQSDTGENQFPTFASWHLSTINSSPENATYWLISIREVTTSSVSVFFYKPYGRRSPQGIYLMLSRRPQA